ncbi:MAG: endo-1,4-beta-xylanase [Bacteroidota bacterium]
MLNKKKFCPSFLQPKHARIAFARHRHTILGLVISLIFLTATQSFSQPLASGKSKFVGNIIHNGYSIHSDFSNYWNQVTPENAGKWGSVEQSQGSYSWTELDDIYNYAIANNFPYKHHNLIWGSQQPSFMDKGILDSAQQYQEIVNWIQASGARYADANFCDVVNEPVHTPPSYINALGGTGKTGWDWVINAFKLARKYWSPNTKLLVNEYSVINGDTSLTPYLKIINLLKDSSLIDGIGVQAHYFEIDGGASPSLLKTNLDKLTATGLPVYISEFDINQQIDSVQEARYQIEFPIFWEDPGVYGITLWGYTQNETWKPYTYLVTTSETERPALPWLRTFIKNGPVPAVPLLVSPRSTTDQARVSTYIWQSSAYAITYELQVALDQAFQFVVVDTTVADTTATPSAQLDPNTMFYWRVCGIDSAGAGPYSSVYHFTTGTLLAVKEGNTLPKEFALLQNYPNPFNPTTVISYQLPVNSFVTLKIYDVLGRFVETLVSGRQEAGSHSLEFNGTNLKSGVYFYTLRAGSFTATRELLLLK